MKPISIGDILDRFFTSLIYFYDHPHTRSMKVGQEQIRWFRLKRSGLIAPFASPVQAAKGLVGVQAQIQQAAGLSLWNRCPGMSDVVLDRLLHDSRSLVKIWGQRGTLHLFASEDWPLVVGSLSGRSSYWEGKSEASGMSGSHYRTMLTEVERLLRESDSLGRRGLLSSGLPLPEWSYSPWGGIFSDLVRKGAACHTRKAEGEGRFVHRLNWLPDLEWKPPGHDEANRELVLRYVRTYGPAEEGDLAYWRGAKMADVRRWLRDLEDELEVVETEDGERWCQRGDAAELKERPPRRGRWPLIMLYRFDPLLLGYRKREWVLDDRFRDRVSRIAGHIEGVVLDPKDGRICATWRYARTSTRLDVAVEPFIALSTEKKRAIRSRAAGVADYFGLPLKSITYAPADPR